MEESSEQTASRPGVVTFVAVILYLQAALAAIAAVSLLIWRDDILDFLEREGSPTGGGLLNGTVAGEAITAILLFIVASGLLRGSNGVRLFVAIVQFLTMSLALFILIAHNSGGYVYRAVFSLFVGVFVLWVLYGNDEADKFFEANERREPRRSATTIYGPVDP